MVTKSAKGAVRVWLLDPLGGERRESIGLGPRVIAVAPCPGSDRSVIQTQTGTLLVVGNRRTHRIKGTSVSGCTASGTPWFVKGRSVSWLG